jgi:hypothetical protein
MKKDCERLSSNPWHAATQDGIRSSCKVRNAQLRTELGYTGFRLNEKVARHEQFPAEICQYA